jgi:hypothetical protein
LLGSTRPAYLKNSELKEKGNNSLMLSNTNILPCSVPTMIRMGALFIQTADLAAGRGGSVNLILGFLQSTAMARMGLRGSDI